MKVIFTVRMYSISNVPRIVLIPAGDFAISQQVILLSPDLSSKQNECDLKGGSIILFILVNGSTAKNKQVLVAGMVFVVTVVSGSLSGLRLPVLQASPPLPWLWEQT